MKKFLLICVSVFLCVFVSAESKYDVEGIYEEQKVDVGVLAKVDFDDIEEVDALYVKTSLDRGSYIVKVKYVGKDFYKIEGSNLYIKTRYCYERPYSDEEVILIIDSWGFNVGEVIFDPNLDE